jgi:uncharacterized membrane protein
VWNGCWCCSVAAAASRTTAGLSATGPTARLSTRRSAVFRSRDFRLTENVAGALCYLLGLITGVLFLVLAPYNQSKFVRFHAFQAIFFHVAMIAFWIVFTVISVAMPFALHILLTLISLLIWLGGVALWLFLMYKAYSNEKFKLPVIGDLAEKQS